MARHGSWYDDGSSLSESLLRFVHGDDEFDDTPAPRPVTQALALTPATRERTPHKPKDNYDLDELTFYYSPEEPGVRGEVRVGLDRSFDRYDEDDEAADEEAALVEEDAAFTSWRDVPRRLEVVEEDVDDIHTRLLSLELDKRRDREDSANARITGPIGASPRLRACLRRASLTCLRLNDSPTLFSPSTPTNLAPPPSPPMSILRDSASQTEDTYVTAPSIGRPPTTIGMFTSRIAQHVESNEPAPSHVARCAAYAAYDAARSMRAQAERVFASLSDDDDDDDEEEDDASDTSSSTNTSTSSDGRCEAGSASGYSPGGDESSAESTIGGDNEKETLRLRKERAHRLLHRSCRKVYVELRDLSLTVDEHPDTPAV